MARSQYGRGGGSNAMFAQLLKEMMGGGETREERELKKLQLERANQGLEALKRADELSDLSLLNSMLKEASTENEFNLLTQTNKEVQKRAVGKDPIIQASINSAGLQIQEDTTLYNQFKSATKLVNGLFTQGELDDPTIENLNWEQIVKKNADLGRFQHMINLGKEKGYTYSPEKGTGEGYLHSNLLSKRLDDYIEEFDVQVKFSMDKGDGGNLPSDARRAIQVGDLVGFEKIKGREISNSKSNYTTHSSRYHSLNTTKMQSDTKENKDSGEVPLVPANIMKDLQGQGEEQVKAYMEALKGNQMVYQAFMGGLKSGSGITVDYKTYSKLLERQMVFESNNVKEANQSYFDWTGSNIEKFREAPDYSKIKETIKKTGLQIVGIDTTSPVSEPIKKEKVSVSPVHKPDELSDKEYNDLLKKTNLDVPKELLEKESKYKGMESDISNARENLFNSHLGVFSNTKKLSKLKSNKKAGYEVSNIEFKKVQDDLSKMKSNVATYKEELKRLGERRKKTFPPSTSAKFEKQVRERAMNILKEKGLKATEPNFKQAMIDARNSMRKDYPDIWGTQVKRGKHAVPYYMTGERAPKP